MIPGYITGPCLELNVHPAACKGIAFVHIVPHPDILGAGIAIGVPVAVDPIPIGPYRGGIAQLIGGNANDFGPAFPIVPEGAHHIIAPQSLIHRRESFPAKGIVPQFVAGLAQHDFDAFAPPGPDLLHFQHIRIGRQLGIGSAAPVDVVLGRMVGRIGVRAPYVPRPQAGGYIPEHLVIEGERADIAAGTEGAIHQHNATIANAANGIGGFCQKPAVFSRVGLAAPFHIKIRFIPYLHIEFEAIPFGQALHHPFEGGSHPGIVGRLFPIVAVECALQPNDRLQAPVIRAIYKVNPALFWILGLGLDAVKHLLDVAVPTDQALGSIQLPVQITLIAAALLHKSIDPKIGVAPSGREGHRAEGESAPANGWVGRTHQRVVDI